LKTLQEIFTRVAVHLLTQNERATDKMNNCVYRSSTGLTCAVGCLVTPEAYNNDMEMLDCYASTTREVLAASGIPTDKDTLSLLYDCQQIHDKSLPEAWQAKLQIYAEQNILQMPQLRECT